MRELEELRVRVDPCRIRCRIWILCWENRRDIELNSKILVMRITPRTQNSPLKKGCRRQSVASGRLAGS